MTIGVTFVTGISNLTVSLLKKFMPRKVRMMVQTLIIAFYVIIVDIVLKAYLPEISRQPGTVRRSHHHQLHHHGPRGGVRAEQRPDHRASGTV